MSGGLPGSKALRVTAVVLGAIAVVVGAWFAYRTFQPQREVQTLPIEAAIASPSPTSSPSAPLATPAPPPAPSPSPTSPSSAPPTSPTVGCGPTTAAPLASIEPTPRIRLLIIDRSRKPVAEVEARLSTGPGITGTKIGCSDSAGVVIYAGDCTGQAFVAVPAEGPNYRSSGAQRCRGPELALIITEAGIVQNYYLMLDDATTGNKYRDIAYVANELAEIERQSGNFDKANALTAQSLAATGKILAVRQPLSTVIQDGKEVKVMSPELQGALIRLQRREGLEPNGVLGRDTIMVLGPH